MNWDQIAGNWEQFRGKVKEKWDQITDDDLTAIAGKRAPLLDLLQVRYGYDKARAEKELAELARPLEPEAVNAPQLPGTGAAQPGPRKQ